MISFAGRRAFVIGGGPSLHGFDFSVLAGECSIAINAAVIDCPHASAFFTEDLRVVEKFGAELRAFNGLKVFHALDDMYVKPALAEVPDLYIVRARAGKYWSASIDDGLSYSSNSAVGAVNLAEILGADPIMLLGIDCTGKSGQGPFIANYHDRYPDDWRVNHHQLDTFASDWEHWVRPRCQRRVVNVINPERPSALKCFETATYAEVFQCSSR